MNASNVAHERTRPVALRTNRSRVLVAALVAPPPIPNVAIAAPLCPRGRRPFPHLLPARPRPGVCYTPLLRPPDGPTDQHVAGSACGNRSPISYELIAGRWARLALMSVLTRGERVIDDLAAVEVNQGAQEGALLIRAPRVDAQRPSDPALAPPLVNVAEEGQRRLMPLDGRAHRRAAALLQHVSRVLGAHLLVELGRLVQPAAVRRTMQVEDAAVHRGHLGGHRLDLAAQVVLVQLTVGLPGRAVGPSGADHADVVVEVDDPPLGQADAARLAQHVVHREDVVVARAHVTLHAGAGQPGIGILHPGPDALHHTLGEEVVHTLGMLLKRGELVLVQAHRVVALAGDRLLHGRGLVLAPQYGDLVHELTALVAARVPHEGHDGLARHIAAQHEHMGAVEFGARDELLPADVGAMHVGGEENAQHPGLPFPLYIWRLAILYSDSTAAAHAVEAGERTASHTHTIACLC